MQKSVLVVNALFFLLISGCSGTEPLPYCDPVGNIGCPASMTCHQPTRTCIPNSWDFSLVANDDGPPRRDGFDGGVDSQDSGLGLGSTCSKNDECGSGYCTDGVCCSTATCPECHSCSQGGGAGTCTVVPAGTTCGAGSCSIGVQKRLICLGTRCTRKESICAPFKCSGISCATSCTLSSECDTNAFCDIPSSASSGSCVKKYDNGTTCTADGQCNSGICQDNGKTKICCDSKCSGACQSCAVKGKEGFCTPSPLGTLCGGVSTSSCVTAGATAYVETFQCSGGPASTCTRFHKPCTPYLCAANGQQCATRCDKHADCQTGYCDLFDLLGRKNRCANRTQTCHVKAGGVGTTGTKTDAFGKIAQCAATKRPYVFVHRGTYEENVTLSVDTELVAIDTTTEVIVGGAINKTVPFTVLEPPPSAAGLLINGGKKVVVTGFTLSNSPGTINTNTGLIFANSPGGELLVDNCLFVGAKVPVGLGMVDATSKGQKVTVQDSAFTSIPAAAIYCKNSTVAIKNVIVTRSGNVLDPEPVVVFEKCTATARDLLIVGNDGSGLGSEISKIDLDRLQISNNKGAGLALVNGSSGTVFNALITQNAMGGVFAQGNYAPAPSLFNVTVADNTTYDVRCYRPTNPLLGDFPPEFHNAIIWGSSGKATHDGTCKFLFSNVSGLKAGTGTKNISVSPRFDSTNITYPYRLTSGSPSIDAGRNTITGFTMPKTDLLGNPRIVKKTSPKATVDQGAYEVQ